MPRREIPRISPVQNSQKFVGRGFTDSSGSSLTPIRIFQTVSVGDRILKLCRALRRAVAFSPTLLLEEWIKRGSKRVTNYRRAPVRFG